MDHMYGRARGVDLLVTHTRVLRDAAVRHGLPAPRVGAYHGVSDLFDAPAPALLRDRRRDILFVGALRREKGVFAWAEILARARRLVPALSLPWWATARTGPPSSARWRTRACPPGLAATWLPRVSRPRSTSTASS
jgi:glycosyltransferase involved in cell wall biosynthesis